MVGFLGLWGAVWRSGGEDLRVEVRGEDGCYCFFEGGYFCFDGFVFVWLILVGWVGVFV